MRDKRLEQIATASLLFKCPTSKSSATPTFLKRFSNFLREGIAPHTLVLPRGKGTSVLGIAPTDPALFEADIALGQPDVAGVLRAEKLRWLQVTSAGFTRYDTAEFRTVAMARGLAFTNSSSVYAEACAEHVFAFMMAHARQLPNALQSRCGQRHAGVE